MRRQASYPNVAPTPAQAAELTRLARSARDGDATARNELFARLADPIGGAAAERWRLCLELEPDEVTSETFLALADLLDAWPEVRFDRFFQEMYGLCLTRRLVALRWPGRRQAPLLEAALGATDPGVELVQIMADLSAGLTPDEHWLLGERLAGRPLGEAATTRVWSRRTLERRWRALSTRLARRWYGADAPGDRDQL